MSHGIAPWAAFLLLLLTDGAVAQPAVPAFDIWDVQLGQPLAQIPFRQIAFAACGTNGGPPSTVLDRLDDFRICQPEPSGLREVYFEYDDELAYRARALRVEYDVLLAGTTMYGHPIIPSVLVDDGGTMRGIRVVTDDRIRVLTGTLTPDDIRAAAFRLGTNLRGQFSAWNLVCEQVPAAAGQGPLGNFFVHDICRGEKAELGQRVVIDAHYFRRRGQVGIDVHSQQFVSGAFESTTRFELVEVPLTPTTIHDLVAIGGGGP